MNRLFDATVALENAAVIIAAFLLIWLHDRWHWMTGPEELIRIHWVAGLAILSSLAAFALGSSSLVALRLMKSRGNDIGIRKTWAVLSLLASLAALLVSLLPVRHG
jgi:hypothetical protein